MNKRLFIVSKDPAKANKCLFITSEGSDGAHKRLFGSAPRKVSIIGETGNIPEGKIGFGRRIFCFMVRFSGKNKSAAIGKGCRGFGSEFEDDVARLSVDVESEAVSSFFYRICSAVVERDRKTVFLAWKQHLRPIDQIVPFKFVFTFIVRRLFFGLITGVGRHHESCHVFPTSVFIMMYQTRSIFILQFQQLVCFGEIDDCHIHHTVLQAGVPFYFYFFWEAGYTTRRFFFILRFACMSKQAKTQNNIYRFFNMSHNKTSFLFRRLELMPLLLFHYQVQF